MWRRQNPVGRPTVQTGNRFGTCLVYEIERTSPTPLNEEKDVCVTRGNGTTESKPFPSLFPCCSSSPFCKPIFLPFFFSLVLKSKGKRKTYPSRTLHLPSSYIRCNPIPTLSRWTNRSFRKQSALSDGPTLFTRPTRTRTIGRGRVKSQSFGKRTLSTN